MRTTYASAILLLRSSTLLGSGPEILLGRRAATMLFLGNYWAFFGGTQSKDDLEVQRAFGLSLQDTRRFTAMRELFEETGILWGETSLDLAPLRSSPAAFFEAIHQQKIKLHMNRLFPAGRYVTPDYVPFRLDTQYFIGCLERDVELTLSGEVSEALFMHPGEALAQWRQSKMVLPSPVRVALSHLSLTFNERATELASEQSAGASRTGTSNGVSPSSDALTPKLPARLSPPLAQTNLVSLAAKAAERSEKARAIDPVDCGDLGGRWVEVLPGVALVPLRTPTLPPATHTNCVLFGTKELLAVDPASPYPEEQKVLDNVLEFLARTRGSKLKGILLTHHHQDHISGAAYLKKQQGVPVYAHPKTAALVPAGLVDVLIEDGHSFELAGSPARKVTALFTPGHAPGHLCYREEHTGITASGDMVASIGSIIIDPSEGDMIEYLDSLRRLKETRASFLIPSHGLTIGDPAHKIDEYIAHRLLREAKVLSALQEKRRAKPQDLLARAYDDTPVALYPLAVRSLLAHLQKLVKDGVVTSSSDGFFQVS